MTRRKLVDLFWASLPPDVDYYSKTIDELLSILTDEQLEAYLAKKRG